MILDRRTMIGGALTAAATSVGTPMRVLAAAPPPAPPAPAVPPELLHPEYRAFAGPLAQFSSAGPPMTRDGLEQMRNAPNPFPDKLRNDIPHERRVIRAKDGHDLAIYVVNARPGTARRAILHIHGGGFVAGKAADAVAALQDLCATLDCVAVSVDYRLAPETRWKGSLEDNYDGLSWLFDHAAELGADRRRIAVMGESAGGGHAALLAIAARDRGKVPLCFQCLVYPMLDDRTGTTVKPPPHVGTLLWTAGRNHFGWESLLGVPPGSRQVPIAAVPARISDLTGLPPAFIGVGTLDLFCLEDVEYAQRLLKNGVQTELLVVPGVFHGFDNRMFPTKLREWFTNTKINALRRGFGIMPT